ncbi:hypothetical protein EOI86_06610 [Hwanghaeella grinnelliae]|uniref:VPLPA-CTERM sorting domain-containing protein n=1 Tax=Hwanghaeella grinnelliae TaxID=2500179 RepID=A0A437QWP2_9PROT|nr:VPLPA-CTERM sorting domain-containing protein [Hwanghaeella grinnelliae]RVU38931.1 hypothetical protein EOI86_06610 [Hwanghaeella grinnelliae]
MLKTSLTALAFLGTMAICTTGSAAVTTFDDLTAFQGALPGGTTTVTETFDSAIANAAVLNFASGVISTATPFSGFGHNVSSGVFNADIDFEDEFSRPTSIVWTFPTGFFAIGFDAFSVNAAANAGVNVTIIDDDGAETFLLHDVIGGTFVSDDGFAGFISTGTISSIEFTGTAFPSGLDTFELDNATFVSQSAVVPLPAALPLMGAALAGFGLLGWRKRRLTV